MSHQDPNALGIDVSHFEGAVDWSHVLASGMSFGFTKATEGLHMVDAEFADNWQNMASVGITRGTYHFFHGNESGAAQAEFFLASIKAAGGSLATDMPPVLDVEVSDGADRDSYTTEIKAWINTVREATRKTPILYGSASFLDVNTLPQFGDLPLWVAHYTLAPQPRVPQGWDSWTFWQYTDRLNVLGVPTTTDANRYDGPHADLINRFGL